MDQATSCAHFEGGPEAKASAASAISGLDRAPLSIDEALNALKSGMWGDVRFIGFKKGSVTLLLEDSTVVNVMTEGDAKPLFDFLAVNRCALGAAENLPKQWQY